jgi:hypothetical protein
MRRATGSLALTLLVAAVVAGCGTSEQKRAVDARTEVLRFFGVDAPAVALLRADSPGELVAVDRAASGIPAWQMLRAAVVAPLQAAGLGRGELLRLVHPAVEIEGVKASALAVGVPSATALRRGQALVVLATDQDELMDRLLGTAADQGEVRRAGEVDGAQLYSGRDAAYAVRDGVLVSAADLSQVRSAIDLRDGDSDKQLDEDVVNDLFADLRTEGPVLAYSNFASAVDADASLGLLARRNPWVDALAEAAVSMASVGRSLQVELVAKTQGTELSESERPAGEAPTSFTISSAGARAAMPRDSGGAGPARQLLFGIVPVAGDATASGDEVRAQASFSP